MSCIAEHISTMVANRNQGTSSNCPLTGSSSKPPQITVLPASARTSQSTIRALLAHPSQPIVKGVYRDPSKAPEEFQSNPRFEVITGDMKDASTLNLDGSTAVIVTIPPVRDEAVDITANAKILASNVKVAIQNAPSVKRVVMVSTKGAQYEHGLVRRHDTQPSTPRMIRYPNKSHLQGEVLSTLRQAEQILSDAAAEVCFIHCAYFMENWATSIKMVKEDGFFYSPITPLEWAMPMVAVKDIGRTCADTAVGQEALGESPYIVELHGPRPYSALDVKGAFEEIAGREIQVKPIPREGLLGFFGAMFPAKTARRFADMMLATTPGGIMAEDPEPTGRYGTGETELVEVLKGMY